MQRKLPFSALLSLIMNTWMWIGVLIVACTLPFTFIFVSPGLLNDGKLNSAYLLTRGQLVDLVATNSSIDEEPVWEFVYEYQLPNGEYLTSFSYSTGFAHLQIGDSVMVQYHPENRYISRIEGMRTTVFGPGGLVLGMFTVIGIPFVLLGLSQGLSRAKLVRHGMLTTAKLVARTQTNMSVNDNPVYKYTYEFTTDDGRTVQTHIKTHKPIGRKKTSVFELIYLPQKPQKALLLQLQPQSVRRLFHP